MGQTTHFQRRLSTLGSVHPTSKKMNGKYVLALVLTLQVSLSLCDVPAPDQELVDKYEGLKATFYKRLLNAYNNLHARATPYMEKAGENPHGVAAKEYIEQLQANPHVQGAVKIITGVAGEASPLVDKARTGALGVYGTYVRPYVGSYLSDAIDHIKIVLDKVMPAEE